MSVGAGPLWYIIGGALIGAGLTVIIFAVLVHRRPRRDKGPST